MTPDCQFQVMTLVGNLTTDPVLKQLDEERMVCQMRIAVNDAKDQPLHTDVATSGAQADAGANYLAKGRAIAVTGLPGLPRMGGRRRQPPRSPRRRRTRPVRRTTQRMRQQRP